MTISSPGPIFDQIMSRGRSINWVKHSNRKKSTVCRALVPLERQVKPQATINDKLMHAFVSTRLDSGNAPPIFLDLRSYHMNGMNNNQKAKVIPK